MFKNLMSVGAKKIDPEIEITVEDAVIKIDAEESVVLDVRAPDERIRGFIEGSENINFYDKDFKEKIEKLDHSKAYIVHCAGGGRSGKTVKLMKELGFNSAQNLLGGFSEWVKKGNEGGEIKMNMKNINEAMTFIAEKYKTRKKITRNSLNFRTKRG